MQVSELMVSMPMEIGAMPAATGTAELLDGPVGF
jgi:hypothetical protein